MQLSPLNKHRQGSKRQQPSSLRARKPDRKQRVLGDFFRLLPDGDPLAVGLSSSPEVSAALSDQPMASMDPGSKEPSPRPPMKAPRVTADIGTATCGSPSNIPQVPFPAVDAHPRSEGAASTRLDTSRLIVVKPAVPGSTPWKPGTMGLYPLPIGAQPSGSPAWQQNLPLWKV
jgi:hypothetical protein